MTAIGAEANGRIAVSIAATATAIGSSFAAAGAIVGVTSGDPSVFITGGAGADTIDVIFGAVAVAGGGDSVTASAGVVNNVIGVDAGDGTNDVDVIVGAVVGAQQTGGNFGTAVLGVSSNVVRVAGGTGADTVDIQFAGVLIAAAGATSGRFQNATASISGNSVIVTLGDGINTGSVDVRVAAANSALSTANAYAAVADNFIAIIGGSDTDTLVVDMLAGAAVESGEGAQARATISDNAVLLEGRGGADVLSLSLAASATGASSNVETIKANKAVLDGGTGADTLSLTVIGNTLGEAGNLLTLDGGGDDDIDITLDPGLSSITLAVRYDQVGDGGDTISGFDPNAGMFLKFRRADFTGSDGSSAISTTSGASSAFRTGTAAVDSNDHFIYDAAAGRLLYDADATGAVTAVTIADFVTGFTASGAAGAVSDVGLNSGDLVFFTDTLALNFAATATTIASTTSTFSTTSGGTSSTTSFLANAFVSNVNIDIGNTSSTQAVAGATSITGTTQISSDTFTATADLDTRLLDIDLRATVVLSTSTSVTSATAGVSNNAITVDVPDVRTVDIDLIASHQFTASSSSATATAGALGNLIDLSMGEGIDTIDVDIIAIADVSASSTAVANALVGQNLVTMSATAGIHVVDVLMEANADASGSSAAAVAKLTSNQANYAGGTGDDAVAVTFRADALAVGTFSPTFDFSAAASLISNTVFIDASDGAHDIRILYDAAAKAVASTSVTEASARAAITGITESGSLDVNVITGVGAGTDTIDIDFKATTIVQMLDTGTFSSITAEIQSISVAVDAGGGVNDIDIDMVARVTATGSSSTRASADALVNSQTIIVGNSGTSTSSPDFSNPSWRCVKWS